MGKVHDAIDDQLAAIIRAQRAFFVATAPLGGDGHINLSPKGGTLAILDPHTVAYLDLTGSGVETIAHLRENGRITLMVCAFEGPPKILRLHGRGTVIEAGDPGFAALVARFPPQPGVRSVIRVALHRIADSCGYGVPEYRFVGERRQLEQWAERKGADGVRAYREENNRTSIDGLPGLRGRDGVSAGETMTSCCIAGGGPAGMMLGLLLARAGVGVIVLEKHADFLRDFRGDTIHPSTLEVMHELGLLEDFLRLPHRRVERLGVQIGNERLPVADFTHLPTTCRFLVFMPQWDFLAFLAAQASRHAGFRLLMRGEVTGLVEEAGCVAGVRATTPDGALAVRADLVVAADGRYSLVRELAGLPVEELGAPIDVLWFRLSRRPEDRSETMGRIEAGRILVLIDRNAHWQCGYVIPKGAADRIRAGGLEAFRSEVASLLPFAAHRVAELASWDDVKLLTVRVDRARRWWRPGVLCIGDAAHAMSPVGGVGINLAIQDAVAAANQLAAPLRDHRLADDELRAVQRRRELPTRVTQRLQILAQDRLLRPVLQSTGRVRPPAMLRLLGRFPILQRLPGRLVGLGVRPEHIRR